MRRLNKKAKKLLSVLFVILIMILIIVVAIINKPIVKQVLDKQYIASESNEVNLYDLEYKEAKKAYRGSNVLVYDKEIIDGDKIYLKVKYKDKEYLILKNNLVSKEKDVVKENIMYVRTSSTIYEDSKTNKIKSLVKKGEEVKIIGFDKLDNKGKVNKYKIKYNDIEGYVYAKYLVDNKEDSLKLYDKNGIQDYMNKMGNYLGGGTASLLDYYPYEKPSFENNVMPDETRTLYINGAAVKNIDSYIEFARENNINAFVIDIKDDSTPAYNSPVMKEYSPTNYEYAINDFEDYKSYVKKAKDAGLYLIGRITTFKDSYYAIDHPEAAIKSSSGEAFKHNGSYWPSAFNRDVWEFNVSLAIEAVKEVGFNEIQFDYVRFPDRTIRLEQDGTIDLNNTYNEEKANAIQEFVMYACDEIHNAGAYVSIDVFGESASNYVTAYGQFWPAISNVVDVISGMPYPDHFNAHEYGISEVVWTVPYKLLDSWSKYVVDKQEIIPTPAKVRTWIQTYNATKSPYVLYDADKISEQIQALYDNGLNDGYMTWNSGSNLNKYKEVSYAFRKVYK